MVALLMKLLTRARKSKIVFIVIVLFLFGCLVFVADRSQADDIKRSVNDICHTEDSRYYTRTDRYESFETLEECLDPTSRMSDNSDEEAPKYERKFFGSGWADSDDDCQNTRQEALIGQSTGNIFFASYEECRVVRGRWNSPYTNNILTNARKVDIDHIIPLKFSWIRGAYKWDIEKRKSFANDPVNLWAVEYDLNRAKGAKGPLEWLPPENQCQYMIRWKRIATKYSIQLTDAEESLFEELCDR